MDFGNRRHFWNVEAKCAKNTLNALAIPSDGIQSEFALYVSLLYWWQMCTLHSVINSQQERLMCHSYGVESRFMDVHFGFMLVYKSRIDTPLCNVTTFKIRLVKSTQASSFILYDQNMWRLWSLTSLTAKAAKWLFRIDVIITIIRSL